MYRVFGFALLTAASASFAFSQSISVTSSEPSVVVGQTAQYSAEVASLSRPVSPGMQKARKGGATTESAGILVAGGLNGRWWGLKACAGSPEPAPRRNEARLNLDFTVSVWVVVNSKAPLL